MPEPSEASLETYRKLLAQSSVSEESVHEMIGKHGTGILDRDFPYLVTVAKGLAKSAARTDRRRLEILKRDLGGRRSVVDPTSLVLQSETLTRVLEALASLPDDDAILFWWHVVGMSDAEISEQWEATSARKLSPAAVRKRRSRTRQSLHRMLDES